MSVKKKYNIGDTVWIYGISNGASTEGKIVHWFNIKQDGWDQDKVHYVVAIPTEIEYLLEVRTWETISQDKDGHVGSLREVFAGAAATLKVMRRTGVDLVSKPASPTDEHLVDEYDEDDISAEAIHAALEKSRQDVLHAPLVIKEPSSKRRNYPRKKKSNNG